MAKPTLPASLLYYSHTVFWSFVPAKRMCLSSHDRYGRGEGFAVAVLALPPTLCSGSPAPAAVIVASAVNQDGRSSGLTAPNGPAQTRLIAGAGDGYGYDAADTKLVSGIPAVVFPTRRPTALRRRA